MPVSRRTQATGSPDAPFGGGPAAEGQHPRLRPYAFHGVALDARGSQAVGDCPFCGKEGKFSVEIETGLWRCWVCGTGTDAGGGNALVFLRCYHERAARDACSPAFLQGVASDRRLLDPATAVAWGLARAPDGQWLVPGYGVDGQLAQLYRRCRGARGWILHPTPEVWPPGRAHALHLAAGDFDPRRSAVVVCEGPWDGMALWEVQRDAWGDANIVAVPGCNVWRDDWTEMCRSKQVTLLYDSDHPRVERDKTFRAGWDGMRRVARRLARVAAEVRILRWGPDGYDPALPDGADVRDVLSGPAGGAPAPLAARRRALVVVLGKVEGAPAEWLGAVPDAAANGRPAASVEAEHCDRWDACRTAWEAALHWRQEMSDALATCLAVCASTKQGGNQLFLDLIGSPGSAKTTMCRGLLVSRNCIRLENMTKLISGYKKPGDGDKDCSFLARANNKTWITCEFDTLGSSPQYHELMGKVRRIFDGETASTYGNSDIDRIYTSLRTPWIRAGTPKMMDHDQSSLGDRFLRYIISEPDEVAKRAILRSALRSERAAILDGDSIDDPRTRRAHALTGGYVDWLRAHVENELPRVVVSDAAEERCIDLAELSADLRARPVWEDKRVPRGVEAHDCKELPTRLARQNIRLATCLAVVLNKRSVDADVLRIVRKVALDTASGHSLTIVRWLCGPNHKDPTGSRSHQECGGLASETLGMWLGMTAEKLQRYVMFLHKIDVLEWRKGWMTSGTWALTERMHNLYLRVLGD